MVARPRLLLHRSSIDKDLLRLLLPTNRLDSPMDMLLKMRSPALERHMGQGRIGLLVQCLNDVALHASAVAALAQAVELLF